MSKYKLSTNGVIRADGACIPNAPGNRDWQEYQEWLAEGNTSDPADQPTEQDIINQLTTAVQGHLDATARAKGYDNLLSAISYAGSSHAVFGPEGIAARNWRDAVWDYCHQVLADCQAGTRTQPTAEELVVELPEMLWPV
jgi:hypothetical protein